LPGISIKVSLRGGFIYGTVILPEGGDNIETHRDKRQTNLQNKL